jgi:hypothetical protein
MPYERLDADVKKVNAEYSGDVDPSSEITLNPIDYDMLDAAITTVKAIYNKEPNKEGINL